MLMILYLLYPNDNLILTFHKMHKTVYLVHKSHKSITFDEIIFVQNLVAIRFLVLIF